MPRLNYFYRVMLHKTYLAMELTIPYKKVILMEESFCLKKKRTQYLIIPHYITLYCIIIKTINLSYLQKVEDATWA